MRTEYVLTTAYKNSVLCIQRHQIRSDGFRGYALLRWSSLRDDLIGLNVVFLKGARICPETP